MKKKGYVIAQNKAEQTFFTSSSSYDMPIWLPINECTVYATAELAEKALLKLLKKGSYSARLTELQSMEFEFPDEGPNKDEPNVTQDTTDETDETDELDMAAGRLSYNPTEDLNLDDDEIEIGDKIEGEQDNEFSVMPEEDDENAISPLELKLMNTTSRKPMRESSIPIRKLSDVKTPDNTKTVLDEPDPDYAKDNVPCGDYDYAKEVEPLHHKVKIPANVMSAIKDTIDMFNQSAEFNNGRDDTQASFSITVADALKTLEDCLKLGTQEGLVQAQIKFTSYMSPITNHIPDEVKMFLMKGERQKDSLKNIFYNKWDTKRANKTY